MCFTSLPLYSVGIFPWQGSGRVTFCMSAIPMWKRGESGSSSCECRQVSSEDDRTSWSPGRDLETRGHTIGSHITLLSGSAFSFLPSPRRLSRPGPRIMSLGVLKSAHTLTGFSTHTGLLTLTGKLLAARKRNPSTHAPHMGAGKLSLTPRT